ncbi:TetR/AcrR family transcriptional regulator [Sphingomonas flavalba]|uniref:TetR/AcrR family transcriptional regulator n=1 Tax=Sphingomonas flavalba TaxID=2559804 RepID=UPI00109DB664|nr:TetR/AcrR family transcriptional regulator [Sphingomonas flavalba]
MAPRDTRTRILEAAIALFNRLGTASVSTNRIAAECGISKGNLNYHYRNRREIILDVFSLMRDEIHGDWANDDRTPTMAHMRFMFLRQMHMVCRYRFFYRDLVGILNDDPLLRARYNELRERRMAALRRFMLALADQGLIALPADADTLDRFLTTSWVLSEHWINYVETFGEAIDEGVIARGYAVLINLVRPYLTPAGLHAFEAAEQADAD